MQFLWSPLLWLVALVPLLVVLYIWLQIRRRKLALRYASLALNAAIQTLRDQEAVQFALLFCEPHNFKFYQSRGWHPLSGEIYAEQPGGKVRFQVLAPFVFDFRRAPRQGTIDLCGLPW